MIYGKEINHIVHNLPVKHSLRSLNTRTSFRHDHTVKIVIRQNYLPSTPAHLYNLKNGSQCRDEAISV